jgi:integrase
MARQEGSNWIADGIDKNGKRRRLTFKKKERAVDHERAVLGNHSHYTIGHLFPQWSKELWLGTKNEYEALLLTKRVIVALGKDTNIRAINRAVVKKFAADALASGNTQSTVNRKLSCLSKLLHHGVEEEVIEEAPEIKLKKDPDARRFRVLSEDEEDRLLAAFEDENVRQFVSFLIDTGCRYGETARLEWRDVDNRSIMIWKSKTGKPRPVPLTPRAYLALVWARGQGHARPWESIVYRTFMLRWHKARVAAGLDEEVIPYACRHTCATRLALGGLDPFRLMKWMGHDNIATTQLYIQLNTSNLDAGVDILSRKPTLRTV